MNFDSIGFAAFCILAIVVLNFARSYRARILAITTLNLIFLGTFFATPLAAVPFAVFVVCGFVAVRSAHCVSGRGLAGILALTVLAFAWMKQYSLIDFLPSLPFAFVTVGVSYLFFRIVHLAVDVHQRAIKAPTFIEYLSYTLCFLTFVSGPVQRYGDFEQQLRTPLKIQTPIVLHHALSRVIWGFFLVGVVSHITMWAFSRIEPVVYANMAEEIVSARVAGIFAAAAMAFFVHLYISFSGYMHIVIGIGKLCGINIPENFSRPYACKNFLEFWTRWNITVSEWFKFYIFNPLLKQLSIRWPKKNKAALIGSIAFFVTFMLMGIWHGTTWVYVVYGAMLGLGVVVNKQYQLRAAARLGKQGYKDLCSRPWYVALCRATTLSYVAVALTCMWMTPSHAHLFATPASLFVMVAAFAFLISAVFSVAYFGYWAGKLSRKIHVPIEQTLAIFSLEPWLAPCWTAVKISIVFVMINVAGGAAPEFIYKAF